MTTATGQLAVNFSGAADQNPWVNADFTVRSGATARIASGVLRPNGSVFFAYTGGTYDGGPITVSAEVNASAQFDEPALGALDENGNGFMLVVGPTLVAVTVLENHVVVDSAGTAAITLAADDLFTFTITKGTPNTLSATQNGAPIALPMSSYALALGTLQATWQLKSDNFGVAAIKSLAVVDGLVTQRASVQGKAIRLDRAPFANQTGITALIYHAEPSEANPNPVAVLSDLTTDPSGNYDWEITQGALVNGSDIWVIAIKDSSPEIISAMRTTVVVA